MISIFGKTPETLGLVHFIGIGGVGMSALAEMLHDYGFDVQGSDISENVHVKRLKEKGIEVFYGHGAAFVDKAFRVVVSSAIAADNPEYVAAKERGMRILHRSELLAEICTQFNTIAISGTHGKTSTTAMTYTILEEAKTGAGVVNGGVIYSVRSNMKLPAKKGDFLVVEADESDGSFVHIKPNYVGITNIEAEHMEHYGDIENMLTEYESFANSAKKAVTLCGDNDVVCKLGEKLSKKEVMLAGFGENNAMRAENIQQKGAAMVFDIVMGAERLEGVILYMPGKHNVQNALVAASLAHQAGISMQDIKKGIQAYRGVSRRFIRMGTVNDAVVIDDYAHHPSEVRATLEAARGGFPGRVIAVFQPHRYTRLRDHMEEFVDALSLADEIIVTPVYAAGEKPIGNVDSERLVYKLNQKFNRKTISYAASPFEMSIMVEDGAMKGDVILCMGAGNINQWAAHMVKNAHKEV